MSQKIFTTALPENEDSLLASVQRLNWASYPGPLGTLSSAGNVSLALLSRSANTFSGIIDARGYRGIAACIRWTTTDPTETLRIAILGGCINGSDAQLGITANLPVLSAARHTLISYPGVDTGTASQRTSSSLVLPPLVQLVIYHTVGGLPVTYEVQYALIK